MSKFHLCVRRSGVFGVEMKTLPCYACECGSHRYFPRRPHPRLTGPMLPADEATWLKQLAEAERSRRAARSTLTASLSTDELLAARPPQPQALPLGHTAGVEAGVQSRHPSIVVTPAQSQQAVSWPPPPPPNRSTNVPFGGTWPPPPPPVTAVRPEGFALSSSAVSSTLSAAAAVYAAGGGFTGAGASGAAGSCTLVVRRPQIVGQALEPDDPALAAALSASSGASAGWSSAMPIVCSSTLRQRASRWA